MIIGPAVAGTFYPEEPATLQQDVATMLAEAASNSNLPLPKAIIAPHAGYIYSGPIAASAYACLAKKTNQISRVVLLAPAHRHPVASIAATSAQFYRTPLGEITIDQQAIAALANADMVDVCDEAFIYEHAVEVQLPFLQLTIENFSLIPLLVGAAEVTQVSSILEKLWGGDETLIIISSDLSHYYSYQKAQQLDHATAAAILALDPDGFTDEHACGATGIRGLLTIARKKGLKARQIDLRNSGDTAGPRDQVVGYGAFHFCN